MGENDLRAMPSAPATPEPSPAVSALRGGIGIAAPLSQAGKQDRRLTKIWELGWEQNGPTEQGMCLIEVANRVSINLTGSETNGVSDIEVQRIAELVLAAPVLARLLAGLEPHLDAIVCFASSTDEHAPNAIAADIRGWLGHLRDVGALAALASTDRELEA